MCICYIVGGRLREELALHVGEKDLVIAADSGYDALRRAGVPIHLAVGDFDSLGRVPDDVPVVQHPVEKDDTDTMLAVKLGLARGYRSFEIFGGLGGRPDHTLANIQTLLYLARRGARGVLSGGGQHLSVLPEGETLRFDGRSTGPLGVFAIGGEARGVTIEGARYVLQDCTLAPDFPLGAGNSFAAGNPVAVSAREGYLLVTWTDDARG